MPPPSPLAANLSSSSKVVNAAYLLPPTVVSPRSLAAATTFEVAAVLVDLTIGSDFSLVVNEISNLVPASNVQQSEGVVGILCQQKVVMKVEVHGDKQKRKTLRIESLAMDMKEKKLCH
ncbi:unnamed protein product [Lactuca virosa]|uniref:Uncharacterized protein n=1 Tax=Lactuca virosa TaxID=75947 RepID=A0AAU9N6M9_9ASTR|nr:unnamed protein product [Lactuca virosa]